MRSLNQFNALRRRIMIWRCAWLRRAGVDVDPSSPVSLSARFVSGVPGGITVGELTQVAFKTLIIARTPDGTVRPVRIGSRCFIGGGAVILPGVTIGERCLIGAGSVVFEDVPPNSIVAGNPARVLKRDAEIVAFGRLAEAVEQSQARARAVLGR